MQTPLRQSIVPSAVARVALMLAAIATTVRGQSPAFLYTVSPTSAEGAPAHFVHADVGYGERVFDAVAAERFEPRLGAQFAFGGRFVALAQGGVGQRANDAGRTLSVRGELLANIFDRADARVLAVGLGAGREYSSQGVALARVVAGFRASRWEALTNLRLERAVGATAAGTVKRDGLDVITTIGASHAIGSQFRAGIEGVGQDLEGLFDKTEAEGGARIMLGPTVAFAPSGTRWNVLVGAGPVLRVSSSSTLLASKVARDLPQRNGYIVRTSVAYRW